MSLTSQKLGAGIIKLGQAIEDSGTVLSPVYVAMADGPMTPPPTDNSELWQPLVMGQMWGAVHGTVWLTAKLPVLDTTVQATHPRALHLHWNTLVNDSLLLQLEATVFLNGHAIGGFDYAHHSLLLPEWAYDGQVHTLTIQVYTRTPLPFEGLTLHARNLRLWRLYHLMHTTFNALLTMNEASIARLTLLEWLNTAYGLLDLREGWNSERLAASASTAFDYLQAHLTEGLLAGNEYRHPRIMVSGHAHLDVGWMWPYWRTRQKITHTISNVLGLMERYPHYYYSQSQPQLLQWVKEDVPELYARVKERVAEGRFELVGAMWVEVDCNLPSGESLIRQIMHGTRFMQEEFGMMPHHIWLPDVFGYSAALPQIMRGCDIPVFMTTKISWNQFNRMPCDTFRWCGIDGSEVLTHFITAPDINTTTSYYSYNGPLRPEDMTGTWANYRQQAINNDLLYLCGWGDGGGGPAEEQLERLNIMAHLPDFPVVRTGRVDEYFESLYKHVWDNPRLPTWVGELYLEYHRGTYTSQAKIKQYNRRAELFYRNVEFLSAWASLYGMPSRQEHLNTGWRRILLNQFHDVLPGSSIREVYDDAERVYAEVRDIGEQVCDEALDTLYKGLGVRGREVLFLNTLPWERTDPIRMPATIMLHGLHNELVQQVTDWNGKKQVLLDCVQVPPCGVSIMSAFNTPAEDEATSCFSKQAEDGHISLHNDYYDLHLDRHGEISSLYDRRAEREVFLSGQTGNQLIAYEDRPLNFDAWDIDLFFEEKPYPVQHIMSVHILEEGPIRVTAEIVRTYMQSRITQRISLWRVSPRIDIATEIDWHEHQTLLKAVFPLAVNSARATYEIQFGSVERPTHRNTSWDMARFEVCAHRWVDVSEGGYGVSLLNDGKYGHDCHDSVLRLTLLKSGIFPDPNADQGLHHFTYSLLPHQGDWREAQTVRRAYELNVPVMVLGEANVRSTTETSSEGRREDAVDVATITSIAAYSFVYTDCPHVVIETVKPAEDGDGVIVRLYEAHNQRGRGMLTFATPLLSVQECNLLEGNGQDVPHQEISFAFKVRPFEIKTFRVRLEREG